MLRHTYPCLLLLVLACGDDGRDKNIYTTGFGSADTTLDGADQDETADDSMSSNDDPSTDDNDDNETGDGDGDDPTTTGDGDGDPTTTGDGDGDPTTTGDGDGDPTDGNPCGNGVIDQGEECDGANLGGSSCVDHGFDGGVLSCDPVVCVFDTSGCTEDPGNECNNFCNGCTCPSFECTMCCAQMDKVDVCGGGMCGCF
jgi:hypothetical protein